MVGNASSIPPESPREPTTWADIGKAISLVVAFVLACVGFFVWVGGQILGYW